MKTIFLSLILTLTPFHLLLAEAEEPSRVMELKTGDTKQKVLELLGEPSGKLEAGDLSIYHYPLGSVRMNAGVVTRLELITEAELAQRQAEEAKARAENQEKGEALLASIKEDEEFASLPAEKRLAFWEQFKKDYPRVDIYVPYTQAKVVVEEAQAKAREEQRLSQLEQRVLMAEAEARRAAQTAETQRLFQQTRIYNDCYPRVIVYPQSYIIRKRPTYHPRPTPYISGSTSSGLNVNFGLNYGRSQSSSTINTTSGFVGGGHGILNNRAQSSF